ncbi:rho guanine nucleotide exchange factor 33 [Cynoglossus semilaevis]|uniref:rho guanine nucleotide exchange factor 33 n=1 Tax=Cynoglossus semilaevis TaxID=244447 RepID=UPI0007DCA8CC|nr:rho guanine nucleotide exchange factor 33 [Cynoglossus semilaevis]
MENGKTEDMTEGVSEDKEETVEEFQPNLEMTQLQGLVAELREGLHTALTELCELRHRDHSLEEKLQAHQTDVDEKIISLKNSLNTFKEELSVALFHIRDVSCRQRDIHNRIQQQQLSENGNSAISVPNSRKNSGADLCSASEDENIFSSNQSELGVIRHFFSSFTQNGSSPQTSNTSTQTSEQEAQPQQRACHSASPSWGERSSGGDAETFAGQPENSRRQTAALELLESERVYVSHLSLLLKANISFNGSDALVSKDKRPFPSSVRFLIQQHLELLHTLQERVLKCQWQGIMGDVFMRLTSKESDFLDFYVSYLKELPDCLSVVSMLASSSMKSSALLEVEHTVNKQELMTLSLQSTQQEHFTVVTEHPYFSSELDSHGHKPAGICSLSESEAPDRTTSCQHHLPSRPAEFRQGQPGSALADALEEFFLPAGPPGMESLYEEDEGSLREISMFDNCSTASSDSSIDIAFVKCPKGPAASHHAMEPNVSSIGNIFGSHGNGYSKPPKRGCVSPDEAAMMRHNYNRPLQASQRKSKSLTGLQMENTVSGSDGGLLSDHVHRSGLGSHAKLERQGSKGSKGCPTPSQKIHSPLAHRAETNKQSEDLHGPIRTDSGIQTWADESRWRVGPEENSQSAFSERSRKQDKGGFRSSFKKLFKKKSSDEKKEKNGEKTPENHHKIIEAEISCKNPKLSQRELNRGTAV